ncbi:MarR family transcriptional regulator [Corynebacterium phocae]|uniref:MarR family transcriptional regulator n=1 Tax=Corynebacterium phocae TaxID=161895 RepID=A0A1L7D576_9CORY|nr:MarR family transcriptional regulator [Corynebacterium phocae]APT93289.1 MarR family transcriptional regulator [Corynebacterium phocae]KAA8721618.1 MarR family transcriptional regulator [Corynebacterium phocae]
MSNNTPIPTALLESPSFQLERVRRRVRDTVESALDDKDTTLREFWVLACLMDESASSQTQLSDTLAIDASDMVRLIDSLEKRGWVSRQRDPSDRRRQIVTSTKKGTKAHKELAELVTEAEDEALDASTNKQLKHLRKLAKSIVLAGEADS